MHCPNQGRVFPTLYKWLTWPEALTVVTGQVWSGRIRKVNLKFEACLKGLHYLKSDEVKVKY